MAVQERKTFIDDLKPNMTREEKNMQLSDELRVARHARRNIVRIERVEIGASGWWIHYRTGSPE